MGATLVAAMIAVPVSAVAAPAGADNETEVSAASVEIPGRVIDAATGKPLAGARVSVVNSTATVSTGDDGAFALKSPSSRVSLKVEFPGYNTVIVPASGRSEVAVKMSQSTGSTVYDTDVLASGATTLVSDFPIGEVAADRSVSDLQGDLFAISRSGMPGPATPSMCRVSTRSVPRRSPFMWSTVLSGPHRKTQSRQLTAISTTPSPSSRPTTSRVSAS